MTPPQKHEQRRACRECRDYCDDAAPSDVFRNDAERRYDDVQIDRRKRVCPHPEQNEIRDRQRKPEYEIQKVEEIPVPENERKRCADGDDRKIKQEHHRRGEYEDDGLYKRPPAQ